MARTKKSRKVGRVEFPPAGLAADIMFDPNTLKFHATVDDETFHHDAAKELEGIVLRALRDSASLVWEPVIRVEALTPFASRSDTPGFVGFRVTRFRWAKKANGKLAQMRWGETETRFAKAFFWHPGQGEFKPPITEGDDYYLPYSEDLWATLDLLLDKIGELKVRLHGLLGTKEGYKALSKMRLLDSGIIPEEVEGKR